MIYQFSQSHFTLGRSTLEPADIAITSKELNMPFAILSDTDTASGMTEFVSACNKSGMDYLISACVTIVADPLLREKKAHNPMYRLRLIVRNAEGMKDLFEVLSKANSEEYFYFHARTSLTDVIKVAARGNLVVTTADQYSPLLHRNAELIVKNIKELVEHFYLELPLIDAAYFHQVCKVASNMSRLTDLPVIHSRPAYYSRGDADLKDQLTYIVHGSNFNGPAAKSPLRELPFYRDAYLMDDEELQAELAKIQRIVGTLPEASRFEHLCDYKWEKLPISLPKMADDELGALVKECKVGWEKRFTRNVFGYKPQPEDMPKYKERLMYEINIIRQMGFIPYFLLVSYVVNWSKEQDIAVGPARGSAAGSLVAYLMGITDVDPIRFGLIFERFLNPERLDFPDIDLDFMSSRREEVVKHLIEKFGKEYVAGISNYSKIGAASAIRDLGRVHGLSNFEINCSKAVPKEHGSAVDLIEAAEGVAEIKAFAEKHSEIWKACIGLQGKLRTLSQHAAGIIVAGVPISERGVVETRKGATVNWDKSNVEDQGLIKLDLLGLSTLDILRIATDMLAERHIKLDLNQIPLDDKKTLDVFAEGRTKGVFQFESGSARKLLKQIAEGGNMRFEDVVAVNALNRPGPLDAGLAEKYCKISNGALMETYVHHKAEAALKETFGVMVYQEQIMQLARDLAGFTMAGADMLRKAIGKKDAEIMAKQRDQFVTGCLKSGMFENDANSLFDDIEMFASYSFNKSHAVAYSLIAFQSAYLKAHYPAVFYAACMSILSDDKVASVARDATADGVIILPPDINKSSGKFEIVWDEARGCEVLYTPLDRVMFVSKKSVDSVLEARAAGPFTSIEDVRKRTDGRRLNSRAIGNLDKVGAFAEIEDQIASVHPDRIRDQKELMGAFALNDVGADRKMNLDAVSMALSQHLGELSSKAPVNVKANSGKKPIYMMVVDNPNGFEEGDGVMLAKKTRGAITGAMTNSGLKVADCYYTSVLKVAKDKNKPLDGAVVSIYSQAIKEEIRILDPAIVVLAGSLAIRSVFPDIKGGLEELSGKDIYKVDENRTYLLTYNPAMLYFKPHLVDDFEKIFARVADMTGN